MAKKPKTQKSKKAPSQSQASAFASASSDPAESESADSAKVDDDVVSPKKEGDEARDADEPAQPAPLPKAPIIPPRKTARWQWILVLVLANAAGFGFYFAGDPWAPWIAALFTAAAITAWIFGRVPEALPKPAPTIESDKSEADKSEKSEKSDKKKDAKKSKEEDLAEWISFGSLGATAMPFFLGILASLEFVKDDAYISFRYAHNLVNGKGLVFNTGERVEGFTNFLWVFILAPFEWLGWDLFQVCEVLGTIMGVACIFLTARLTAWVNGERRFLSQLWGALWLSTSSSFALWAKSGLEQPLAALLPVIAAYVLWRARYTNAVEDDGIKLAPVIVAPNPTKVDKRYLYAGLLMGAGCMTRPELHLLAVLIGIPLIVDAVRARKITKSQWLYVAGILAFTIPCHAFRYSYYGSLVPNTFYVKTGTGANVWVTGLKTLNEMFLFNHMGILAILAPLAFANRRRIVEKITMAIIALAFMAYYVKVGTDEMQWHRLYLPALPFLCVLAALGAQNLVDAVAGLIKKKGDDTKVNDALSALVWAGLLAAGGMNFKFTYGEMHGFNGHGDLAGTFHPDMGKFVTRHERPGALVAFQDVGSTPYHAPDIDFLDFIGLVDHTVAHARHDYGLHAFIGGGDSSGVQKKFNAEMRDYYFKRRPEWAILTIYGFGEEEHLHDVFEADPTGGSFGNSYRNNNFQFGIWDDPRFRDQYVAVRTWPRGSGYYLALWRRRDLWEQTPREVVLETVPEGVTGARAKFDGNLELLGSELTPHTIERHEVLITTWWKLPGKMAKDLYFFVHVKNDRSQVPADHIPGDWMYPADRWKEGQILEDRILFQLPPFVMRPGTYQVLIGVYQRSTGKRLDVIEGAADEENRVMLGTFDARKLHPIVDQLIPPTRVDVMRKYPGRITDPHR